MPDQSINEPWHDKTNKMNVRPGKTQISQGINLVWSESSLCAQWVAKDPIFLHADSKDSDQTGQSLRWAHMPLCWFCHEVAQMLVSKDFRPIFSQAACSDVTFSMYGHYRDIGLYWTAGNSIAELPLCQK